ncbi:hypothetical protein KMW28_14680 [Flammeovirga yaeyamensis]|uniref:DUF4783 domain-containing protein n=1 Tax=Flammeovirga yaeyamensis TaxID=367791 RepID=A0AAX1N086_9BACT|nr:MULTISPECIES: hypothetical protein [Flammeovirga]ANQ47698.1 hypothetical protein MY04_0316 [Flammeovirga sp. MY04]MBB3700162.1 mRNA-degrading endonuclease RelE of RelBE toxin-antitoxin system [Flammeovirga yaeyamensis]NMF37208.1 hypothetical protein [Flammeovirga yaeyamensis]QWG00897.1 hypothetical protein KMW28_14680 [Flammeovirga yaeyamensis]
MKNFTLALIQLVALLYLAITPSFATELDKLTDEHLSSVKNKVFTEEHAKSFILDYIGIHSEGKADYLYHTGSEDLVAKFKKGIKTASLVEVVKTKHITNVYFKINDVLIHTSYFNETGEMNICRFKHKGKSTR